MAPYALQPSYEELQQTKKNPVAAALEAAMQGKLAYNQAQEFKAKMEQQKLDAYISRRKAGFSQSDSWKSANMTGPVPTGEDTFSVEKKKSDLETRKTEAEIGKLKSESIYKPQQDARKQQRQDLMDSTKLREEFINRPETKDYLTVSTNVRAMDSLLADSMAGNVNSKVALDQALITMYNKLTDPQSVVRESEYARTPQNLPLVNAISGAIQKVQQGGAGLTDQDRQALVAGAKIIADERGKTYNATLASYEDLGNQYGIDPSLITRGMTSHAGVNGQVVNNVSPDVIKKIQSAVPGATNIRKVVK